jgi:hypothetical protein
MLKSAKNLSTNSAISPHVQAHVLLGALTVNDDGGGDKVTVGLIVRVRGRELKSEELVPNERKIRTLKVLVDVRVKKKLDWILRQNLNIIR